MFSLFRRNGPFPLPPFFPPFFSLSLPFPPLFFPFSFFSPFFLPFSPFFLSHFFATSLRFSGHHTFTIYIFSSQPIRTAQL